MCAEHHSGRSGGRPRHDVPGTIGTERRPIGGPTHRTDGPRIAAEGTQQDRRRFRSEHRAKRKPWRQQQQQREQQQQQRPRRRPNETSHARESKPQASSPPLHQGPRRQVLY